MRQAFFIWVVYFFIGAIFDFTMPRSTVPRCDLLQRTIHHLKDRPRYMTLDVVSKDTGLSLAWLHKLLRSDSTVSPQVCSVVRLYEYLTQTKLPIK